MRKILSIFIITTLFAGNLEVEGGIVATQGVTASSFVGDGSGLTNLQSLGGEKPERIYGVSFNNSEVSSTFVVPSGKVWALILVGSDLNFKINGNTVSAVSGDAGVMHNTFWVLQNDVIWIQGISSYMNILEYSISGSGNEQGMDYVEP